ncbi:phosphoprotein phosphatase [Coprinopsis sp. MPI-PUGE-AT-0042]|nr:phosphoprotein phosphatase [Coprinopsis sp. MPI-PUGE-AT-0042]
MYCSDNRKPSLTHILFAIQVLHDDHTENTTMTMASTQSEPRRLANLRAGTPSPRTQEASSAPKSRASSPSEPPLREPSEEYLAVSAQPSSKVEDPRSHRKLLVLDLNGTLVYRGPHQRRNVYQQPPNVPRPLRTVHPRPNGFDTMVWSSAQPHSVSDMVRDGLKVVWARDTLGLSKDAYFQKTQTTKDLEKPWQALGHSAKSTFLLDDSPKKAHLQPWNHLCIREYVGPMRHIDVKVRDAELLREQKERAEIASDSLARRAMKKGRRDGGKRRRRRKGQRKFAALTEQDLHPVDSNGRPLEYDQTLLAVIGVLDAIKEGGQRRRMDTEWRGLSHYPQTGSASPSNGPLMKKRRVSGESAASPPPSSSSPPQSPIEGVSGEAVVLAEKRAGSTLSHPTCGSNTEESFRNWADCGRRALAELGIEINPGIKVQMANWD